MQEPNDLFQGFGDDDLNEGAIAEAIYCRLIERDDRWQLIPELAERVPSIKTGDVQVAGGKMKVTFKLRRGWKWHDGTPVTASDFVWTLRVRKNPNVHVTTRELEDKIENVYAPDPYTVTFVYKEIFARAQEGYYLLPAHILRSDYQRGPSTLDRSPYGRAPVHCGPYRLKQWIPGVHLEAEASPETWGGTKPAIRRIYFRFDHGGPPRVLSLIAGETDAIVAGGGFTPEQSESIERGNPSMRAYVRPSTRWVHIDFNLDMEWLRDRRFRIAVAHAIDREALVRALFRGHAAVAHTFFPPEHFAHSRSVRRYSYDPPRARALLADAGFSPGSDGVLLDSSGRRVQVTLMTVVGSAPFEQAAAIIQEQLRQIGVDVKIDTRPLSIHFRLIGRREFGLAMFPWIGSPSTSFRTIWHSAEIPTPANGFVGNNVTGYRNGEVDRLLDTAERELDQARRRALLLKVQELWAEDLPAVPLYFGPEILVAHRNLRNFRPRGIGAPTWNMDQWSWGQ